MINLYSLFHLLQWYIIGILLIKSWLIFILISLSWEILEIFLPYRFAEESYLNKFFDIIFNTIGFYLGRSKNIFNLLEKL